MDEVLSVIASLDADIVNVAEVEGCDELSYIASKTQGYAPYMVMLSPLVCVWRCEGSGTLTPAPWVNLDLMLTWNRSRERIRTPGRTSVS